MSIQSSPIGCTDKGGPTGSGGFTRVVNLPSLGVNLPMQRRRIQYSGSLTLSVGETSRDESSRLVPDIDVASDHLLVGEGVRPSGATIVLFMVLYHIS
jgi:hypothetical protein